MTAIAENENNKRLIINEVILNENKFCVKFDTVKIKANEKCFLNAYLKFNDIFNPRTGERTGIIYNTKDDILNPYNLFIAVSYTHNTLTLEFSSKILLDDYPKLISKFTIRKCLENINKLGICQIDVESILETGCFTRLDVTKDVDYELSDKVLNELNENVKNYKRYKWSHYINSGITFTKDVKSVDCKESITVYNKEKELSSSANNRKFLNSLSNKAKIYDYFRGKTRFEIKLSTQVKIMDYLNISDTKIQSVLNSISNPILKQFNRVFGESTKTAHSGIDLDSWENYCMYLALKEYDFNLKLIDQKIRNLYPSSSGYYDRKNKIEKIHASLQINHSTDFLNEIRNLLI